MPTRKFPKSVVQYIFLLSIILGCSYSHAVVINFDDIERVHEDDYPFWADQPITNQYASKGLIVDGGYLNSYQNVEGNVVSGPNYLQGGPYLSLIFVGIHPKVVSMVINSNYQDVAYLDASCLDGELISKETKGWAGPHSNTPFVPNQIITFRSEAGISHINISAFHFLRTSVMIDDLTYHYSLPEPGSLLLLGIGFLFLAGKRILINRT